MCILKWFHNADQHATGLVLLAYIIQNSRYIFKKTDECLYEQWWAEVTKDSEQVTVSWELTAHLLSVG